MKAGRPFRYPVARTAVMGCPGTPRGMELGHAMKIETDEQGGRIFFSSTGRSLEGEDQICILSVGVDIGSSTSHLVFSRIVLERLDSRYVVTERETFYQSDILLTPYASADTIDADALGAFLEKQYENALVDPDEIDAGALILTGVAVRRSNARRIGELFARQAGKLVAVSAGDNLETVMAAYGSGAVARSIRDGAPVMNVDVGGGTSKIAVCRDGAVDRHHGGRCGRAAGLHRSRAAASPGWRRPAAASGKTSASGSNSAANWRRTTPSGSRPAWPTACSRRCEETRRKSAPPACCALILWRTPGLWMP